MNKKKREPSRVLSLLFEGVRLVVPATFLVIFFGLVVIQVVIGRVVPVAAIRTSWLC